jgi:predicted dinucleotide-utilizing enzyme
MSSAPRKIVNIGLVGCGEVAQVIHIPTLLFMRDWFRITYLCDVSAAALEHCSQGLPNKHKTTRNPEDLCASDEVDVVLVANSDEYHAAHAVLALQHDKHVLVEKPLALTKRDVQAVIDAEEKSKGSVMVGYMRRFASPFEDAVKEIGGIDKILYARVRGTIPTVVQSSDSLIDQISSARTPHLSAKAVLFRRSSRILPQKTRRIKKSEPRKWSGQRSKLKLEESLSRRRTPPCGGCSVALVRTTCL